MHRTRLSGKGMQLDLGSEYKYKHEMYTSLMQASKNKLRNYVALDTSRRRVLTTCITGQAVEFVYLTDRVERLQVTLKGKRPPMTWRIILLAILGGVGYSGDGGQNIFAASFSFPSTRSSAAIGNLVPTVTYMLAVFFGLDTFTIYTWSGRAKSKLTGPHAYPVLSASGLMCGVSSVFSLAVAMIRERDSSAWKVYTYMSLVTILFTGIFGFGALVVVTTWCTRARGPTFVSSFTPLSYIFTTLLGSLLLGEEIHTGSIIGGLFLVIGICITLWGKCAEAHAPTSGSKSQPGMDTAAEASNPDEFDSPELLEPQPSIDITTDAENLDIPDPGSTSEVVAEAGIPDYPEILEPQLTIEIAVEAEILNIPEIVERGIPDISEPHSTAEVAVEAEILNIPEIVEGGIPDISEPHSTAEVAVEAEIRNILELVEGGIPDISKPHSTAKVAVEAEVLNIPELVEGGIPYISEPHSTVEVISETEILHIVEPRSSMDIVSDVESSDQMEYSQSSNVGCIENEDSD
ncbi:hypothetical protein GQ457_07G006900 [Hibiscus cannabinus]